VAVLCARLHCMPSMLAFLNAGGAIDGDSANYKAQQMTMRIDQWQGLADLAALVDAGAMVEGGRETGYDIRLAEGLRFELASWTLADGLHLLAERFVRQQYADLDVQGKVVIDIGCNIGDSAIYFAARGAAKVYGYEPFVELQQAAARNVALNSLERVVDLIPAGVGGQSRVAEATYDPVGSFRLSTVEAHGKRHRPSSRSRSEQVCLMSFRDVLAQARHLHPDLPIVCKMDCEGCEFDTIPHASPEDLGPVSEFIIEYHHRNTRPIILALERAGFMTVAIEQNNTVGLLRAYRAGMEQVSAASHPQGNDF
jgi:FkbM family methyltransferase